MSYKRSDELLKLYDKLDDIISKITSVEEVKINDKTLNNIRKILNSIDMEMEINTFVGLISNNKKLSSKDKMYLKLIIESANYLYSYSGYSTGISDSDYDILVEGLNNQLSEEFNPSLSTKVKNDEVVKHRFPSLRGTLDKVYYLNEGDKNIKINKSRKGLPEWIKSSERKIKLNTGKNVNLYEEYIYVFPKFDGVSCILEFNKDGCLLRALTRGDTSTNEAQDITSKIAPLITAKYYKGMDLEPSYGVKTEIMMSEGDLNNYIERFDCKYKNSRSIVSGILNTDDVSDEQISYLTPMYLRRSELNKDGTETLQKLDPRAFNVPFIKCKLKDVDKIEEFAKENKYVNGKFRTDGAVIYIIDEDIQKALGRENHKQKFEVAYKFTEESAYTKLIDVIFQVGLFGNIAPIAVVKPVKLKGNTISRISLGSMQRFNELKLSPGDTVKILYDIIPYLTVDDHCILCYDNLIKAPKKCPDCKEPLQVSGDGMLSCKNPKCPSRKKGKILNYLRKIGIDGISYATIDVLYEERILRSIEDIYTIPDNADIISQLPGFGHVSVNNMVKSIQNHISSPIQANVLLGAIGIEGISIKTFDKLSSMYKYEEIIKFAMNENVNAFTVVPGIKEKTANKIINGINENMDLIEFLYEKLNIVNDKPKSSIKVAFTKIRDKDLEKWIEEEMSGSISDQVTKDVDVLIVPDVNIKSSKADKAKKYGIEIININDAKDYITKAVRREWE